MLSMKNWFRWSLPTATSASGRAPASFLFMMSMPFTLVGTFSGYLYLQVRKARKQLALDPSSNPFGADAALPGMATASR